MTPDFCCGWECGILNGTATILSHWRTTGAASIDTSTVRTGARSLRINSTGSGGTIQCNTNATGTDHAVRFYIRFASLPSGNCYIYTDDVGTTASRLGIAFNASDNKLYCAQGTTPILGAAGITVTTGVWYCIDLKMNHAVGSKTVDGKVDGADLAQKTSGNTDTGTVVPRIGIGQPVTADVYYDDFVMSSTAADYPIGASDGVKAFVPVSDGTHNVTTAGDFKVGSAGSNITNSTTDSYQYVDDVPIDDTTPDTNDYINQSQDTGGASEYVEHVLGHISGGSTPTVAPRAVEVIVAYHQQSTGTGNSTFKLNDNGTEDTVFAFNAAGTTAVRYQRKHYPLAPTGGAWTVTSGNGNFNNLRSRFGYSTDGNPDQYFDCVMIEADFPTAGGGGGPANNGQGFFSAL